MKQIFDQTEVDWKAGVREWRECTEEFYWHCLEVLPPTVMRAGAFLLGEPYIHDGQGYAVRQCCIQVGKKYYTMLMNRPEFNEGKFFDKLKSKAVA